MFISANSGAWLCCTVLSLVSPAREFVRLVICKDEGEGSAEPVRPPGTSAAGASESDEVGEDPSAGGP